MNRKQRRAMESNRRHSPWSGDVTCTYEEFEDAVNELIREGKVIEHSDGKLRIVETDEEKVS